MRFALVWAVRWCGVGGVGCHGGRGHLAVDEDDDLPTVAAGRWNAFPDSEPGGMAQFAFVLLAVYVGTSIGSLR
ncbi:hypothetical protein ABZ896_34855 [Streptomyces sp. NPDC047072]|uniref:hypothetical protein n=1 Tax=Streptomyces sp. NPDC047072 TaxID=3154809 RepID=UPI0033E481BF